MPLDAARDGLIAVQGQLIMLLAQRNSGLGARVSEMEDRQARLERTAHQVIGTPVVTAAVTQHDEHAVACCCGRVHVAAPPPGAGTVTYGPNVQAWAVFLLVMHHVPVERCADVIGALTGTRPSDGFVHAMPARAARAVRGACMLIRALVITASVLCADETRCAPARGRRPARSTCRWPARTC